MANQGELTYFLKCHGFVKIGKTTTLKSRIEAIQATNPYELKLIGVTFEPESDIHDKFEPLHERGEWYHLTGELKRYISSKATCLDNNGNFEGPVESDDPDVIAVGKSKSQQERIRSIRDIIKELEREAGSAHIDTIIERAGKLGFEKEKVEAEVTRLAQEAAIFEAVRYSQNYRLTQQ